MTDFMDLMIAGYLIALSWLHSDGGGRDGMLPAQGIVVEIDQIVCAID